MPRTTPTTTGPPATRDVDVLVVGGGPAGLAAALALGRSRRSVLVVDAGRQRNLPAAAMHAFLTRDGTAPQELLELGRQEVAGYGVEVVTGTARTASRDGDHLLVACDGVGTVRARRLVVTTGLVDELPEVDGLAERWGRDVVHCPYCHGYEVRDRRIAVLATSPDAAVHQAGLFRQLSDDVVVLQHTSAPLGRGQAAALAARGVVVVTGVVTGLEVLDDELVGVRLADGDVEPVEALVVASRFAARSALLGDLGVPTVDHPSGMGTHVPSGTGGRTDVPGVWVAGNVTDPMAQVVAATAQGNLTGAHVNADLVAEDTAAALAAA